MRGGTLSNELFRLRFHFHKVIGGGGGGGGGYRGGRSNVGQKSTLKAGVC